MRKLLAGAILLVLCSGAKASDPTAFYYQANTAASSTFYSRLFNITSFGNQGANSVHQANAIQAYEAAAEELTYDMAVVAGVPFSNDGEMPVRSCNGSFANASNPVPYLVCATTKALANYDLAASEAAKTSSTDPTSWNRNFYVGAVSTAQSLVAPFPTNTAATLNVLIGMRGGIGYLDGGFQYVITYLNRNLASQANFDAAAFVINRGSRNLSAMLGGMAIVLTVRPCGCGDSTPSTIDGAKDNILGPNGIPFGWNTMLDALRVILYQGDPNPDGALHRIIDAWARTDVGGYWLSEL